MGDFPVVPLGAAPRPDETNRGAALSRSAPMAASLGVLDAPASVPVGGSDFWIDRRRQHSTGSAPCGGNLSYLATVGMIATAIVGVFFGAGFLMLLSSPERAISLPVARDRISATQSPVRSLPAFRRKTDGVSDARPASTPMQTLASAGSAGPSASLPSTGVVTGRAAAPQEQNGTTHSSSATLAAIEGDTSNPSSPRNDADAAAAQVQGDPIAPANSAVLPDRNSKSSGAFRPSAGEISELLAQGDSRLSSGDVALARLFYERAVAAGDGRAALRLGATFDPVFLRRAGLRNVQGDAAKAQSWYSYAADRGAIEATRPPESIETSQGR